jgi:hypothetical protein
MSQELVDQLTEEVRAVLPIKDMRIGEVFQLLLNGISITYDDIRASMR